MDTYCHNALSAGITNDLNCCIQSIRGIEGEFSKLSQTAKGHYVKMAQCSGGKFPASKQHAALAAVNVLDSLTLSNSSARITASENAIDHAARAGADDISNATAHLAALISGNAAADGIGNATANMTAAMSRPNTVIESLTTTVGQPIMRQRTFGDDLGDVFNW
jgi:hypothetical protein